MNKEQFIKWLKDWYDDSNQKLNESGYEDTTYAELQCEVDSLHAIIEKAKELE